MRNIIKVLSVDWDFFFPDPSWYDWSHNEESGLGYEFLWQTRPGNRNIRTGEVAHLSYLPNKAMLDGFWGKVLGPSTLSGYRCPRILVCESHRTLGEQLLGLKGVSFDITNYDQHHDLGYDDRKTLDCGNWAAKVMERRRGSTIRQVYPAWRAEPKDGEFRPVKSFMERVSFSFWPDAQAIDPAIIFVCRSSCWTPPWADDEWLEFLKPLEKMISWEDRGQVEFVSKARHPGKAAAKSLADQWELFLKMKDLLPSPVQTPVG